MNPDYILISDGTSDRVLLHIIDWTFLTVLGREVNGERADFSFQKRPPISLAEKISAAANLYETGLIIIHRDAEKETIHDRDKEIETAIEAANSAGKTLKIIPVRMTEAWLLFDAEAILKTAAAAKNTVMPVLPDFKKLEMLPDPKETLSELLRKASGLAGRRLKKLNVPFLIQLLPQFINDFSPLEKLPSFQHFRQQIEALRP